MRGVLGKQQLLETSKLHLPSIIYSADILIGHNGINGIDNQKLM